MPLATSRPRLAIARATASLCSKLHGLFSKGRLARKPEIDSIEGCA